MQEYLVRTSHSPRPLPSGPLADDAAVERSAVCALAGAGGRDRGALLPEGLVPDTFQGSAWLGVVPFWLDRIKVRGLPTDPWNAQLSRSECAHLCPRPNTRGRRGCISSRWMPATCWRWRWRTRSFTCPTTGRRCGWISGRSGSLRSTAGGGFRSRQVIFKARYRGWARRASWRRRSGTLEYFLMERSSLFTRNRAGQRIGRNLHHVPWPLEEAEAEIERNDLAAAIGIELPDIEPVLHYSRRLAVYVWPTELGAAGAWRGGR
jgi:uncharacterized protein